MSRVPYGVLAATEAFTCSRVVLILVTAVAAVLRRQTPMALWDQWDSVWYLGIAQHGYHWAAPGHLADAYRGSALAFFPLFPLLLRLLEGVGLPGMVAGLALANLSFFAALLYLCGLIRLEWGARVTRTSLFLLAFFPTAFFTFAPYTESLFLLASAGALYHAYRRQFLRAGLWLAIGLLTRSTGLVLILPVLMLLRPRTAREWIATLGPVTAGWMAYLTYLSAYDIPLNWLLGAQRAWHRGLTFPWTGFVTSVSWLLKHGATPPPAAADDLVTLGVTVLFLLLTAAAWPGVSSALKVYFAGFWVLILVSPEWLDAYNAPFSSVDRFVLALFPLAGWAATKITGRYTRPVIVLSAVSMAALATLHLSGSWVG